MPDDQKPQTPSIYEQVREIEHALEYASRYFGSHADQRLKTLRYFLAYILLLSAGLYKVLESCHYGILTIGSFAGLVITLCFFSLELRNRQLVNHAALACGELEEELIKIMKKGNDRASFAHINIVQKGEKTARWWSSYRYVVPILFGTVLLLQILVVFASLVSWLNYEFDIKIIYFDFFEKLKEGCSSN